MIKFSLKCAEGHNFESWFQSSEAFEKLRANDLVTCAQCGSNAVEKTLMSPQLAPARKKTERSLSTPMSEAERALRKIRKEIEETSDYVGLQFASEARKMHLGDAPERPIYGEAKLEDAKKLIEDGVPVAPLPFKPQRKVN